MDLRKINSYMILLAIVVVVGLFVSTVARLVILAKGVDAGTANLVFLIMLGTCAIAYLTILAAFSSIADFIADKILPKIARKKALTAEATRIPPIDDIPDSDVEQIKQEADKRFLERQKEQIELFRIDFEWDAEFRRERVGDVPTELFRHFFHSLCCAAGRPIVQIGGINDIIRCQFFRLLGDLALYLSCLIVIIDLSAGIDGLAHRSA